MRKQKIKPGRNLIHYIYIHLFNHYQIYSPHSQFINQVICASGLHRERKTHIQS